MVPLFIAQFEIPSDNNRPMPPNKKVREFLKRNICMQEPCSQPQTPGGRHNVPRTGQVTVIIKMYSSARICGKIYIHTAIQFNVKQRNNKFDECL